MADEPRRKRKWDNQGEDEAITKKASVETSDYSPTTTTSGSEASGDASVTAAEAVASAAATVAALAAAKLNAKLAAQGVLPTTGGSQEPATTTTTTSASAGASAAPVVTTIEGASGVTIKESKERDEFVADIDINDIKHRYVLTKGSVQTQIQKDTGADVTTRGKYYADRSLATEKDPPLYLHISATSQEILDQAVAKVNELIEEAQNPAPLPQQPFRQHPGSSDGGPPQ
ncbi:hypothetical protein BGZ94_007462, partial [Podila epigama]